MILVSKLVFGSVALATLAGSVIFPDAGEAASTRWGPTAQALLAELRQAEAVGNNNGQLPPAMPNCSDRCDVGHLFSNLR